MCSSRKEADRTNPEYSAARGRLLSAIDDLIATEAWRGDGAGNLQSWLAARWQISAATAGELVHEAERCGNGRHRELERRDDGIYLRMEHTTDERYMRGAFQLHPEDGAAVLKAIEARIPSGTALRDWDKAAAAGLVEICRGPGSSVTVVVSIGADDVAGSLDTGGFVGAETARRLSCDGRVQTVPE